MGTCLSREGYKKNVLLMNSSTQRLIKGMKKSGWLQLRAKYWVGIFIDIPQHHSQTYLHSEGKKYLSTVGPLGRKGKSLLHRLLARAL